MVQLLMDENTRHLTGRISHVRCGVQAKQMSKTRDSSLGLSFLNLQHVGELPVIGDDAHAAHANAHWIIEWRPRSLGHWYFLLPEKSTLVQVYLELRKGCCCIFRSVGMVMYKS